MRLSSFETGTLLKTFNVYPELIKVVISKNLTREI